jgi:hypothetical protein
MVRSRRLTSGDRISTTKGSGDVTTIIVIALVGAVIAVCWLVDTAVDKTVEVAGEGLGRLINGLARPQDGSAGEQEVSTGADATDRTRHG